MTLRSRLAVGALAAALGLLPGFIPPAAIFAQSPPAVDDAIPDLDALIRDMREKGPRCHGEMGDFTLTFTFFHRKFEKNGKTRESLKSFEVFAPESYRNRKSSFRAPILLVAENGMPVAPEKLAKERENLTRELDEFERDPNKSAKKKKGTAFYVSPGETKQYAGFTSKQGVFAGTNALSPSVILSYADFGAGRRETLDGRETVAVEFRVQPDWKFDKSISYVAQLEGIVWIDVRDRTLVRLEGWQRTWGKGRAFLSNPRPAKAPVLYEQMRVADGVWFPRHSRLFDDATTTMFASLENAEVGVEYGNYRRFRSEITVTDDEEK
jgi:hypothetical protein